MPRCCRVCGRRIPRWPSPWPRVRSSCRPRRAHTSRPSLITGTNGSVRHSSSGPVGTTSVCPAKQNTGPPLPRLAQKLSTGPKRRLSTLKPMASSRSIISAWQPPSVGLTEARAISSSVSCRVASDIRSAAPAAWRRRLTHTSKAAEHERRDQHPRRHGESQEAPGHLGAFTGAGQHLDQHLAQGEHLEHEIERCAAGRDAARRQTLNIQMPQRPRRWWRARPAPSSPAYSASAPGRRDRAAAAIRNTSAQREHADALKDAQRTGLQVQHELGVVGVGQQALRRPANPRRFPRRAVISGARARAPRRSAWRRPRARYGGCPCRAPCRSRTRRCSWRDRRCAPARARST